MRRGASPPQQTPRGARCFTATHRPCLLPPLPAPRRAATTRRAELGERLNRAIAEADRKRDEVARASAAATAAKHSVTSAASGLRAVHASWTEATGPLAVHWTALRALAATPADDRVLAEMKAAFDEASAATAVLVPDLDSAEKEVGADRGPLAVPARSDASLLTHPTPPPSPPARLPAAAARARR